MAALVNGERLAAFERLLALPDPKGLKARGHRLTCQGDRERMQMFWQRCARAWMQHRVALADGPADGWKPAQPTEVQVVQFWPPELDSVLFRNVTH